MIKRYNDILVSQPGEVLSQEKRLFVTVYCKLLCHSNVTLNHLRTLSMREILNTILYLDFCKSLKTE